MLSRGYVIFALATWTCVVTVQMITSTILDVRRACKFRSGGARHQLLWRRHHSLRPCVSDACSACSRRACSASGPRLRRSASFPACSPITRLFIAIGVFILGFGGSMFFTAAQNATGNIAPKSRVPFVSGMMTSMMNLGPFIAPYLFAATVAANPAEGNDAVFPVLIAMCAVCAVIGLLHPMRALVVKPADGALDEGAPSSAAGADEIR